MVVTAIFVVIMPTVSAHMSVYGFQAGAWGDAASRGNMGVQVKIRTHIYNANSGDLDYFWVGDNLDNGEAFIQFGYSLEAGHECLRGEGIGQIFICYGQSENVGPSDGRWEWQYWPNGQGDVFYFGKGPAYSAGFDGSWHTYSIMPNVDGGWDFVFDGEPVASIAVQWTHSEDPAFFVAEKATGSPEFGNLGPVEFADLSYLTEDGWHSVSSLTAILSCAVNTNCNVINPYSVSLIGPNDVEAGSIFQIDIPTLGIQPPSNNQLLWTAQVTSAPQLTINASGLTIGNVNGRMSYRTGPFGHAEFDLNVEVSSTGILDTTISQVTFGLTIDSQIQLPIIHAQGSTLSSGRPLEYKLQFSSFNPSDLQYISQGGTHQVTVSITAWSSSGIYSGWVTASASSSWNWSSAS